MALGKILLVRHDVTAWNSGKVQGTINTKLQRGSATRINEVVDLIVEEENFPPPQDTPIYIVGSELDRVYDTAEGIHLQLHRKHGLKSASFYTKDLNERHLGELEDKSFERVLEIMAPDSKLAPTPENVYPILYLSDEIPGGEPHEGITERLTEVNLDYVVQNYGIGIFVVSQTSGMNHFHNLLTHGNILALPYRHKPNLSVVRMELDAQNSMRYVVTKEYGPPGVMEATSTPTRTPLVVSKG